MLQNTLILRLGTVPIAPLVLAAAASLSAAASPHFGGPDAAVMAVVLLASIASSIAGFAFSAVCGAALFHLLDDRVQVVQIMIICSIANQAAMVWSLRRAIDWSAVGVFLAGGVAGLPFGLWILLDANRAAFKVGLGTLLVAYSVYMLFSKPRRLPWQHPAIDALVGFCGGITGGAVGFPGAAPAIWCAWRAWSKVRQRALVQPFILVMQVAALLAISVLGGQPAAVARVEGGALLCVPAALLGTQLGMACFARLSNRQFAVAVNLLLLVSGLSYLV